MKKLKIITLCVFFSLSIVANTKILKEIYLLKNKKKEEENSIFSNFDTLNNKGFESIKQVVYSKALSESEQKQQINNILLNLQKEICKNWNKKINELEIKHKKELDLYKDKLLIIEKKMK